MQDVLVLNFTYETLNITNVRKAIRLVFSGKAEVLDEQGIFHSVTATMKMPLVIRMLRYIDAKRKKVPLTKKNVLRRDNWNCGYCGITGDDKHMTVDHIKPQCRGGKSTWENLVACCRPCNSRKDDKSLEVAKMALRIRPKEPNAVGFTAKRHPKGKMPAGWAPFLFA